MPIGEDSNSVVENDLTAKGILVQRLEGHDRETHVES